MNITIVVIRLKDCNKKKIQGKNYECNRNYDLVLFYM